MKANELRIGNYVTDEFYDSFKSIFEVDSINEKGINLLIEDDGNWTELAARWIDCEYNFDELRGIPLTEQWLLDFGAREYLGSKRSLKYSRFDLFWRKDYKYWYVTDFENETYMTKIEFVHEFQNFIFAMDQEELTIKEKV